MTLEQLKIEEKELYLQLGAINMKIAENRRRRGEICIEQFKVEKGLNIGDDIMEYKTKFKIVDFEFRHNTAYAIGSQYKKDGTLGVRRSTLYNPVKIETTNN
jgi:hypothetical protein